MKRTTWYHEMGFFSNPFSTKPSSFDDEVRGYDIKIVKINKKIAESNIVFIHGKYGTGKTSILKGIIAGFRGKKRVIYYNCNQSERSIDFNRLLINAGGFFRRLFRIRKKNMIILLDEAQDMNKKDISQTKKYYDDGFFRSIIFVSTNEDIGLTKELKELVKENTFRLNTVNKKEAVKIIRKRIGELEYISDKNISMIFAKNRNPRAFLKNCEDVFRSAYEIGKKSITKKDIKKI